MIWNSDSDLMMVIFLGEIFQLMIKRRFFSLLDVMTYIKQQQEDDASNFTPILIGIAW